MGEIIDNAVEETTEDRAGKALERRLWYWMSASVALVALVSVPFFAWRVTAGLLLGGMLSLFNHHWLSASLAAMYGTGTGKLRGGGSRYFLRYLVVAGVVVAAVQLNLVSLPATLVGLCSFAAALMLEAARQFYLIIVHREET